MSRLQPAQLRLQRRPPRLRSRHGCSPQRRQRPPPITCCARPMLQGMRGIPSEPASPSNCARVLCRAVLKKLYPRLPVRAALLWTETPELMEIYAPALDAQLAALSQGMSELDPATPRS